MKNLYDINLIYVKHLIKTFGYLAFNICQITIYFIKFEFIKTHQTKERDRPNMGDAAYP